MTQPSGSTPRHPAAHKAQSFVEFAIFLPIFLIIVSGLIEFGFLLNEYMNLLDGPREGARFATDYRNPLTDANFFPYVADEVVNTVSPVSLDETKDDIVISIYSSNCPKGAPACSVTFRRTWSWAQSKGETAHASEFDASRLEDLINSGSGDPPPSSGIVLVELFYAYNQKMKLPWITWFVPDPIHLSTYTIMPMPGAE